MRSIDRPHRPPPSPFSAWRSFLPWRGSTRGPRGNGRARSTNWTRASSELETGRRASDDGYVGFVVALVALLLLGVLYQKLGIRRGRRRFAPPGHLIDVGGHHLHVRCS